MNKLVEFFSLSVRRWWETGRIGLHSLFAILRRAVSRLACVFAFLLAANSVEADWINLTGAESARNIAEITILDDRVHIALEIFVQDLETFEDLIPDTMLSSPPTERADEAERLRRFSTETFKVVSADGTPLPARLLKLEPRLRKDRKSCTWRVRESRVQGC